MLSTAGTSRASAVVPAARQAAPLSLRTAMHDIGLQAGCSADSGNFQPRARWTPGRLVRRLCELPAGGRAAPPARTRLQRLSWTRYGIHDQARAHSRRANDPQADRLQCGVWTFAE